MLLPVLSMAKSRAQMAIDLNNVHQIMLAVHMYAGDNNGYLPNNGEWMNVSVTGTIPNWCNGVPFPEPGDYGNASGNASTYALYYPQQVRSFKSLDNNGNALPRGAGCQFTPYLKNEKVLRCPSDVPNTLFYQRQQYITSYCWNYTVYNPNVVLYWGGQGYNPPLKLSQFKADDILVWENDETLVAVGGNAWGAWDNTCNPPDVGISARHGKGAAVGNADGSAEWILLSTFYRLACNHPYKWTGGNWCIGWQNGQRLPNRLWNYPTHSNGVP
jgi:hypothetical protein